MEKIHQWDTAGFYPPPSYQFSAVKEGGVKTFGIPLLVAEFHNKFARTKTTQYQNVDKICDEIALDLAEKGCAKLQSCTSVVISFIW